jgi:glutamate synthase (NADPH/NADH) small chain
MPLVDSTKRPVMPQQKPEDRIRNFDEVPLGLSLKAAREEAGRCLQCKKPLCVEGCPVNIDIPGFITKLGEKDLKASGRILKDANCLPAVCGRVCPQEDQCEKMCILGRKGDPIAIGYLERFVADYEREHFDFSIPEIKCEKKDKIAVVGSGPSGLTCASQLRKMGYQVTVFEAFHVAGGVLVYGIPEFRLPKTIVAKEIETLEKMGVEIKCNQVIGRIKTIDELFEDGYKAVYIGVGAGFPVFMDIPGEDLNFVYSSNEFLTRINLMKAYDFPNYDTPIITGKRVAVIGGGNTAMDSARSALRLKGVEKVFLIYRRSEEEIPARIEEIHHAQEEGVEFMLLTAPVQYFGDESQNVKKARCIKMELGRPDTSGRRRPVPISGSEFEIDIDSVVVAIGTRSNPLISQTTPELEVNKWGYIITGEHTMTTKEGVFAGGDIVTGAATVILAMGAGKKAANAIDEYVKIGK